MGALSLIELQAKWYSILEKEEFPEIEDVTREDRPLKEWAGIPLGLNIKSHSESDWPESPFLRQEELLHHPEFIEFCKSICWHGNFSLNPEQLANVWELHTKGKSCREIGEILQVNYMAVYRAEKKLMEWAIFIEQR